MRPFEILQFAINICESDSFGNRYASLYEHFSNKTVLGNQFINQSDFTFLTSTLIYWLVNCVMSLVLKVLFQVI